MNLKFVFSVAAIGLLVAGPALAVVVIEEDFEDDVVDESMFFVWVLDENSERVPDSNFDGTHPERGLGFQQSQLDHINGAPTNTGRPGRWIPNQYKIGSPDEDGMGFQGGEWFDNDVNPDTNWQPAVVTDFRMMSINPAAPPRDGNEGFLINHHQGDCTSANPCQSPGIAAFTSYKLAREAFIKFTDAAGNDVATQAGDVLRGSFDFVASTGIPIFGFSSNIQQMADDTGKSGEDHNGDGDLDHEPLTKSAVGFGQAFHPMHVGIPGWQGQAILPEVVSQIGFSAGFNQTYTMTWTPVPEDAFNDPAGSCQTNGNCATQVHLDPDSDLCTNPAQPFCTTTLDDPNDPAFSRSTPNDVFYRYQTLAFEYTVGNDFYDVLTLDGQDVVACDSTNTSLECDDGNTPGAPEPGNVPISRPGDVVDGIFFGSSGKRNGNTFFFDDICVTINESLDGCSLTGGEPGTGSSGGGGGPEPTVLIGDANNDDQVTGADLIAVQQNFGTVYPSDSGCDGQGPGDANDDCQVTGSDLIAVQQNFGTVASAAPVPEPATAALVGLGLLAAIGRRRRA